MTERLAWANNSAENITATIH